MILYKEYIKTQELNKEIKLTISFNKSKINRATNQPKKIGYQVTAIPVEISSNFETFTTFTGFNDCLLEIERQSPKRLNTAIKILQERKEQYKQYFKNRGFKFN
jgi:hypothetical protein